MTTEIAVMNRNGVALAADSAITVQIGDAKKILNSGNKLFALSKYEPVGVMFYNSTELMGVPWETIFKTYRGKLGEKKRETLAEYMEDFLGFIKDFPFPPGAESRHVRSCATTVCLNLVNSYFTISSERLKTAKKGFLPVASEIVQVAIDTLRAMPPLDSPPGWFFSDAEWSEVKEEYGPTISDVVDRCCAPMPLTKAQRSIIMDCIVTFACSLSMTDSGLVMAGFGEKEVFPSCISHVVYGVFRGKLMSIPMVSESISLDKPSAVVPFAQSEEVKTFMDGVAPQVTKDVTRLLKGSFLGALPTSILASLVESGLLAQDDTGAASQVLLTACKSALSSFGQEFESLKVERYSRPFKEAAASLRPSEMADVAETLVNLVSFRKQVTMDLESVGGPIDVAVITKGNGLVWVKRKHYFPQNLNHQFFSNYFRDQPEGNDQEA